MMAAYGRDIVQPNHCGPDYQNRHPMVLQAYNGFIAYQPLYQAGCLRDSTGNYCFANAITNTTSNTDSYPYYLPLGVGLPGGSRPTCNSCLRDTMAIFNTAAANKTQPISQTYSDASQQINMGCGPEFANTTVANGAPALGTSGGFAPLVAVLVALYILLL
ncbi:hypothetical protein H2201_004359 [Coniosporium apollinis]|uniref:DUF7729 domain-containing protein n=2 Tax=Coniosporium TaxID=2810619 RepID=A0ABQ9NSV0_9PEZI|nr:hypothetical protein H2201_004359 [Coniosporium apollinis]